MTNAIDFLFDRLRSQSRKAFMPFLTAGDPDLAGTACLLGELASNGANLIEIGFPYSDPIADGPVIQASYTRALGKGVRIDDIFALIRDVSSCAPFSARQIPLVAMVSYSLVQRRGAATFLANAAEAGFSGLIVPELPLEETDGLARLATDRGLKLIQLVTPTTPRERALQIAEVSTGFLYYVSVAGITGERGCLPEALTTQLRWLRGQTKLPICVGFGISKPEHARQLREVADGIIVGSALVRLLEQHGTKTLAEIARDIGDHARSLAQAVNDGSPVEKVNSHEH